MTIEPYKLAIVGVGPRGGYALECLIAELARQGSPVDVQILLFEETSTLGSGPVYRADQPETNWINITERALELNARPAIDFGNTHIPRFPEYHEWANLVFDTWPADQPDTFPPRSKIGRYLRERCGSLVEPLVAADKMSVVVDRVIDVRLHDHKCILRTSTNKQYSVDDVLLTIGHQPTREDKQIRDWAEVSKRHENISLHTSPYPIEDVVIKGSSDAIPNIAIRGYGLAMMDVARAFGETYGFFEDDPEGSGKLIYRLRGAKFCMAPFSLDGLTMGPKPYTPKIDAAYRPSDVTLNALSVALSDTSNQIKATGADFLVNKMVPIIASVYESLSRPRGGTKTTTDDLEAVIKTWLLDPDFTHELLMPNHVHPSVSLQSLIDMAMDRTDIYLDYCAGQVWRHCQLIIYAALSHSQLNDDVLADIIALDERLKRYSFGPPVDSLQQLRAMCSAGVLNLNLLNDPDIICGSEGWVLSKGAVSFTAQTMIDSVLDGPKLLEITSPLLKSLLNKDLIQPAHDQLGVLTDNAGYIKSGRRNEFVPIAILGRIAKGTVIGVDAILECFGERPLVWAKSAVEKFVNSYDVAKS